MSLSCSCIRNNFDAYIKALDTKKLMYKDASDWSDDDDYIVPEKMTVQITPPGTSKKESVELLVATNNIITIFDKLKSGIYCIELTNCGKHYTKSVALFPNLECCVKQAWATLDIDKQDKIREVESYLDRAATNAEFNNVKAAAQNLDIAEKLLRNLKCDCSC